MINVLHIGNALTLLLQQIATICNNCNQDFWYYNNNTIAFKYNNEFESHQI